MLLYKLLIHTMNYNACKHLFSCRQLSEFSFIVEIATNARLLASAGVFSLWTLSSFHFEKVPCMSPFVERQHKPFVSLLNILHGALTLTWAFTQIQTEQRCHSDSYSGPEVIQAQVTSLLILLEKMTHTNTSFFFVPRIIYQQFIFIADRVFTSTEKVLDTKGNRKMASDTVLLFVKLQKTKQQQRTVLICKEFLE